MGLRLNNSSQFPIFDNMKSILFSFFALFLVIIGHAQTKADSCVLSIRVLYLDFNAGWCVCPNSKVDTCVGNKMNKPAASVQLNFTCNNKDVTSVTTNASGECSVKLKKDQYVISFQWPDGAKASTAIDITGKPDFDIDQGCETTLWGYAPDHNLCIVKRIHIPLPRRAK